MSTPVRLAAYGGTLLLAFGGAFGIGAAVGTPLVDERPVDHSDMDDMDMDDMDMDDMDMDDMNMNGMADQRDEETP